MRWANVVRWIIGIPLCLTALAGCATPGATTLGQGAGLPVLRHLDWGTPVYDAAWAPNGRWIAVLAGNDYAGSHLAVVSPDGRYQRDLSSWGCGDPVSFSFAWRPDSTLSCINNDGRLITGAYPFSQPRVHSVSPRLTPFYDGAVWSPDGAYLVAGSSVDPWDPERMMTATRLYIVEPTGRAAGPLNPPGILNFELNNPQWMPWTSAISWVTGNDMARHDLMASAVVTRDGAPALGAPRGLATGVDVYYAWAPSGRWAVVRYADYRGGAGSISSTWRPRRGRWM